MKWWSDPVVRYEVSGTNHVTTPGASEFERGIRNLNTQYNPKERKEGDGREDVKTYIS